MKTILYVGYYVDNNIFDEIVKNKVNDMSAARQSFESGILRQLSDCDKIKFKAISYVPDSKLVKIPDTSIINHVAVKHIPIRKKSLLSLVRAMGKFWRFIKHNIPDNSIIIMYAVNPIFMIPLVMLKNKRNLKLVTICSEVPNFRRYGKSLSMRVKKSILTFFNDKFDRYILFTDPMKEVIDIKDKQFLVMEGIANDIPPQVNISKRRNIVMYAGGLHPDNNLDLLIESINKSEKAEECWICGSGPMEEYINAIAKNNSKIKMLGRLNHDEVKKLEKEVKILVNLRDPNIELTKYSFPSKTIEYLASGAEVVSTRLEGIPNEYFKYVTPVDDLISDNLANVFDAIMSLKEEVRIERAKCALDFLRNEKSAKIQTEKIIEFVCR